MNCSIVPEVEYCDGAESAYGLLLNALSLIPVAHYLYALSAAAAVFLYHFLEFHIFEDARSGFRGCPVTLTCNPCSEIYDGVVSKCRVLHERYLATPWLSSPHIQTAFLNFFGRPPSLNYEREIFEATDGGRIALDWLTSSYESGYQRNNRVSTEDPTPIVVVTPGLMSDSSAAYIRHLAFHMAKHGWNVVISNHRGQGGIEVTSDCFYNAGWTDDIRAVINFLSQRYPRAPLFVVGTSIGANILVKYLGEDGENVPVAGAAAICCPWDLLVGDRFIGRRLVQQFYDRAITIGLQSYAVLHQTRLSRVANWTGIEKSRKIRDFDNHATCHVGKFETVDTYYRRCSSANYIGNVSVPLLCISALDDPVCTKEAIPWDECRLNKNVILATTKQGGHLGFFEGITGASLWWVRSAHEFLHVLHSSPYMHVQKMQRPCHPSSLESSVDQGPFVNVADGMVAPMGSDGPSDDSIQDSTNSEKFPCEKGNCLDLPKEQAPGISGPAAHDATQTPKASRIKDLLRAGALSPMKRFILDLISRSSSRPTCFLAYIAIIMVWPMVGSALRVLFVRKFKKALPAPSPKR